MSPLLLAALVLLRSPTQSPPPDSARADLVRLVDSAVSLMQAYAWRRDSVNWDSLRAAALTSIDAPHLAVEARAYYAIQQALRGLGDHHSFVMVPSTVRRLSPGGNQRSARPESRLLDDRIGYLKVPAYSGFDSTAMAAWATDLQQQLRTLVRQGACGWVVDLRGNTGGNMWPMLAGIGPLLAGDTVGWFVGKGERAPWGYSRGHSWVRDATRVEIPDPVHIEGTPPVAVLTDGRTASSGEAVVVAFRGRPRSRSFGEPTLGVPTGNAPFSLPGGAILFLTTAADGDRTGRVYAAAITPDETVPADSALEAAQRWLAGSSCAGLGTGFGPSSGGPLAENGAFR